MPELPDDTRLIPYVVFACLSGGAYAGRWLLVRLGLLQDRQAAALDKAQQVAAKALKQVAELRAELSRQEWETAAILEELDHMRGKVDVTALEQRLHLRQGRLLALLTATTTPPEPVERS